MTEDFKDPRDVDWHPRRRRTLYGHQAAEMRLLKACQSGKLHHAWLLSGPRGIGKATLAYRFAKFLLHTPDPSRATAHTSLYVAPEAPAARQVAAASHPDLLVVERAVDQRSKRLKSEIAVDDARKALEFFSHTSSSGWRVAIVDSADDLNSESANALLKVIEEPPRRSVFLLVCHQPGGLLRTIRSRSIRLPLGPLSIDDTLKILDEVHDEPAGDRRLAAELANGSPGRALELLGSKGAAAFADFKSHVRLSPAACAELGAQFAARDSGEDYAIFTGLLIGWIAEKAREAGLRGRGAALALAHDDIVYSLRQTDALNLDRRQTAVDALLRLEEALKAS